SRSSPPQDHRTRPEDCRAGGARQVQSGSLLPPLVGQLEMLGGHAQPSNSRPWPRTSTRMTTGSVGAGGADVPRMDSGKGKANHGAYNAPLILHIVTASGSMS